MRFRRKMFLTREECPFLLLLLLLLCVVFWCVVVCLLGGGIVVGFCGCCCCRCYCVCCVVVVFCFVFCADFSLNDLMTMNIIIYNIYIFQYYKPAKTVSNSLIRVCLNMALARYVKSGSP